MKKHIFKNIEKGVALGLVCAAVLSFARFEARLDELRSGVLRLHILANSDSDADQELKLKVRDRILEVTKESLAQAEGLDEAIDIADGEMDKIIAAASEVVSSEGFTYNVSAAIEENFFENRDYGDFTLPAGVYNSLTVRIGDAKGHNWWCVVFPGICLPAAEKGRLEDTVSYASAKTAREAPKYKVRFKAAEIYERIRHKFSKK
ncbi:MAG: stage II sporulation protein R [Clostridia bacterium]|nr:stage II sporulation protein R [Clostridia bacterium]